MTDECRDLIIAGATVLVAVGGITCFAIGVKQGAKRERNRTKEEKELMLEVGKTILNSPNSDLPEGNYIPVSGTGTFGELINNAKEVGITLDDDTPIGGIIYLKAPAMKVDENIKVE